MEKIKLENFSNYWIFPTLGMVWSNPRERTRGGWIGKKEENGYWKVSLVDDEGKTHKFQLHRLIYIAVYGEISEDLQVNHIDEDKDNNSISNLNLMTRKENINYGTGIQRSAENRSKEVGAFKDGILILTYPSTNEAGRNGFNQSHISACCKGKLKTHKGFEWRYLS